MKKYLDNVYTGSAIKNFLVSILLFGIVTGLYNGVFNNFLHEILQFNKLERGWLELPREMPGLLIFLLLAALNRFTEIRLIRIAFVLTAAGLAGLFLWGNLRTVAVILFMVYSTGEHLMMPVRQSVGLHLAKRGKSGMAMGIIRGFGNAGQAAGFYLAPVLILALGFLRDNSERAAAVPSEDYIFLKYRIIFLAGFVILVAALAITARMVRTGEKVNRKKIFISRKYIRYYLLEIFFGARKQVFLTFAPYVLITVYDAGPELISLLYGIWSLINIFIGPVIGRFIDHAGYKKVLIIDSIILIIICFMYGFAHRIFQFKAAFIMICAVFVLDSVMFAFGMARDLYARSLSENKAELTSTLATGLSVNHLISIIIAIFGGFLWERLGIEYLFGFAAVLGIGSLVFSALLQKPSGSILEFSDT